MFIEVVVQQPGIVVVEWLTGTHIGEENGHYSSPYGAVSHRVPAGAGRDGDVRFDMRAVVGDSKVVVLVVGPVLAIGVEEKELGITIRIGTLFDDYAVALVALLDGIKIIAVGEGAAACFIEVKCSLRLGICNAMDIVEYFDELLFEISNLKLASLFAHRLYVLRTEYLYRFSQSAG